MNTGDHHAQSIFARCFVVGIVGTTFRVRLAKEEVANERNDDSANGDYQPGDVVDLANAISGK